MLATLADYRILFATRTGDLNRSNRGLLSFSAFHSHGAVER